ncbi:MAG: diphthine--ammonia ligase [Crocinitomicaceae bacterium]|nr:diphthine--ammonia ligase [Crocinitomicaceae bacterium]
MSKPYKTYFNWSTGKDSAFALYKLQQDPKYSIELLLTSVNSHFNRVSMHGLRRSLLEAQASSLEIVLKTIELPESPTMEEYKETMTKTVKNLIAKNYTHAVFGDIFLEDLKNYRDQQLQPLGIETVYPLWQADTSKLIHDFIDLGFKAVVVSANSTYLDEDFVGQTLTHEIIDNLPKNVDPCGENGEFHTFCYDGPIFKHPISFSIGEKIYREYPKPKTKDDIHVNTNDKIGYWYCDLLPA